MTTTLSPLISLIPLVAAADEGYQFDELTTRDAGTIADVSAAINMNGDYSTIANFVRQDCDCW